MGVEAMPYIAGARSLAKIVCDDCGFEVEFACAYSGRESAQLNRRKPNINQARAKASNLGWTMIKNRFRCPECEKKRKVKMAAVQEKPACEGLRSPSKRERIEIFTLLAECYDIDAGRYLSGETDDSVADVLNVMPGWVAQIREAEFGPDGGNEDIDKLAARMETFEKDARALLKAAEQVMTTASDRLTEISEMKAELSRIKKALSPRISKASGVRT